MQNPKLRANLIQSKTVGVDPIVDAVLASADSIEFKLYKQSQELYKSPTKKNYLESSLLASKDMVQISELLELPLDLVTMYRDVFYNVTDLDKLSKLELLDVPDQAEKGMKTWALSQGLDFVSWRLGNKVSISPVEGLKDLFSTCIFKSKEALFSGNASDSSRESTKWVKLSMDIARLIKIWVLDSAAAKADLEMALREVIPDFEGLDKLDQVISEFAQKNEPADITAPEKMTFESIDSLS